MAAPAKDKVLVIGSNASTLRSLHTKVSGIHAKNGPFTCLLCLGNLFSSHEDPDIPALLDGSLVFPLPTYFIQGDEELPAPVKDKADKDGGEIAENLSFLGVQSILTLSSGLKLSVFSGSSSSSTASSSLSSFLSNPQLAGTDILLLNGWPSTIQRRSSAPLSATVTREGVEAWGEADVAEVLKTARPKYAFVGSRNLFWEREPFLTPSPPGSGEGDANGAAQYQQKATRFLSVGNFGNTAKQRWFYAFGIAPSSSSSSTESAAEPLPANITPSPFEALPSAATGGQGQRGIKRTYPDADLPDGASYIFASSSTGDQNKRRHGQGQGRSGPPESYTCRLCGVKGHWIQDCDQAAQGVSNGQGGRNGPPKEIAPEECWFCLSNPNVTKHLIASIGSETYLTLPKGQLLATADKDTLVPGGGHCLIIPIAHYPTLSSVPGELSAPVYAEIASYVRALTTAYAAYECVPLSWEVSRSGPGVKKSGHAHIQICPVPERLAKDAVRIILEEGQKEGLDLTVVNTGDREGGEDAEKRKELDMIRESGNYFSAEVGGKGGAKLVHRIKMGERFNLQFGRATAALILGTPGRADWKACAKSDDEEAADAKRFKEVFAKYDPSG